MSMTIIIFKLFQVGLVDFFLTMTSSHTSLLTTMQSSLCVLYAVVLTLTASSHTPTRPSSLEMIVLEAILLDNFYDGVVGEKIKEHSCQTATCDGHKKYKMVNNFTKHIIMCLLIRFVNLKWVTNSTKI